MSLLLAYLSVGAVPSIVEPAMVNNYRLPSSQVDVLSPMSTPLVVQVRIASGQQLTLVSSTQGELQCDRRRPISFLLSNQTYTLTSSPDGFLLGEQVIPDGVIVQPTNGGFVEVNDHWYASPVQLIIHRGVPR